MKNNLGREREIFNNSYVINTETGCWIWKRGIKSHGYGYIIINQKDVGVHRLSWTLHYGSIPDGLFVCHTCDVKACVNPQHLFLGTRYDNIKDMVNKGRQTRNIGERNGSAKLTSDDVIKIRQSASRNGAKLARELNVSTSLICRVRKGKIWKHALTKKEVICDQGM